ncbi:hypothetical protein LXA44_17620, partial [Erwinia amylovora]|nr:hypothetical protein [Erwinia amylovora]
MGQDAANRTDKARHASAYFKQSVTDGPALVERGFEVITAPGSFVAGDVVIIKEIKKSDFPVGDIYNDLPYWNMVIFNGKLWVSYFKQNNG